MSRKRSPLFTYCLPSSRKCLIPPTTHPPTDCLMGSIRSGETLSEVTGTYNAQSSGDMGDKTDRAPTCLPEGRQ